MNYFRTTFDIASPDFRIGHGDTVFMVGSCFAENMAEKLRTAKFDVMSNPAGVIYNPLSVVAVLTAITGGRVIGEGELVEEPYGGVWSSFLFHGSFSDTDRPRAAQKMNDALVGAREKLTEADIVIITMGTSWVYELKGGGDVVANCHKFPVAHFDRRRLGVGETVAALSGLLDSVLARKKVILTVSPVRHLKDGAQGNSVSKASLMLAADELCRKYGNVYYFPAYELVYDDLRDYRFYAADMVHPSQTAVDYIWERFCEWVMTDSTRQLVGEIDKINAALGHRPLNPGSKAWADFRNATLERIEKLVAAHPGLEFEVEIKRLKE